MCSGPIGCSDDGTDGDGGTGGPGSDAAIANSGGAGGSAAGNGGAGGATSDGGSGGAGTGGAGGMTSDSGTAGSATGGAGGVTSDGGGSGGTSNGGGNDAEMRERCNQIAGQNSEVVDHAPLFTQYAGTYAYEPAGICASREDAFTDGQSYEVTVSAEPPSITVQTDGDPIVLTWDGNLDAACRSDNGVAVTDDIAIFDADPAMDLSDRAIIGFVDGAPFNFSLHNCAGGFGPAN